MITTDLTGNLGNQMWQYAICRTVAEKNGYSWGFNRTPSHDYYNGIEQMAFMDIDYGLEHNSLYGELPSGIKNLWKEKKVTFNHLGLINFHPFQPDIFDVEDNSKLIIDCCQDERYLLDKKEDIRKWFSIKPENILKYQELLIQKNIGLNENLCVVNIRGGSEYRAMPNVILEKKYWENAIANMKLINPEMRFIVITDDIKYAKKLLSLPTYHFSIGMDYFIINQAYNLILSNSSFALLPAWLNQNCKNIIAPKYWARHNISFGYWASSAVYMKGWKYQDREGKLLSYEDIIAEEQEKRIGHGKIYDAFLFFNELDLLEIRLNTLDPVIDYFVIVESTKTFSGLTKELFYNNNKKRFEKYQSKILHYIVADTPDNFIDLAISSDMGESQKSVIDKVNAAYWWPKDQAQWGRESYQRESLVIPLSECKENDIILISDLDEIPNPEIIKTILQNVDINNIYHLENTMFSYFLNCKNSESWVGTFVTSYKIIKQNILNEIRMKREGVLVKGGGWHFSYLGGIEQIKIKIESYSHQEFNNSIVKDNIENSINNLTDIFGRKIDFTLVPIDDSFPKYILENQEKFHNYIKDPKSIKQKGPNIIHLVLNLGRKGKRFLRKIINKITTFFDQ